MNTKGFRVAKLSGQHKDDDWEQLILLKDVIVMTAQVLVNLLQDKKAQLTQVDLLVFIYMNYHIAFPLLFLHSLFSPFVFFRNIDIR